MCVCMKDRKINDLANKNNEYHKYQLIKRNQLECAGRDIMGRD